jgi:alpha-ketoglutarate-dependent taurine dioxygenase
MLLQVNVDPSEPARAAANVLDGWKRHQVVHIQARSLRPEQVRAFYDELIPSIGTPHFLAEDVRAGGRTAQRTGELWMEVRYDPTFPDAYRHTANAQPLHTDGSYIRDFPNASLMCCVRNAGSGGETTFITAEDVVQALEKEDPALLRDLERIPMPHERSGDRRVHPVIRKESGVYWVNWNYYCVAPDAPEEAVALRQRFFDYLKDSSAIAERTIPVKLHTGDAIVWKDDRLLHGRNAFQATAASERFLWKCCVDVGAFPERAQGVA